jgi:hypothetical protein
MAPNPLHGWEYITRVRKFDTQHHWYKVILKEMPFGFGRLGTVVGSAVGDTLPITKLGPIVHTNQDEFLIVNTSETRFKEMNQWKTDKTEFNAVNLHEGLTVRYVQPVRMWQQKYG